MHYDTIVIGSGVAGSMIAARLAGDKLGANVLLLEAGDRVLDRTALAGIYAAADSKNIATPYRTPDGDRYAPFPADERDYLHEHASQTKQFFKSGYVRRGGGSTWHWLGNVPRLVPNDFRLASKYGRGVDWPLRYEDLEPWYCRAEAEIGVAGDSEEWAGLLGAHRSRPFPMSKIWPAYGDSVVRRAVEGLVVDGVSVQLTSTPQARNSQPYQGRPPCAGNSSCVPLCPIGAKYDATVHLRAAEHVAEVRYRSVVYALEADAAGRIIGVRYRRWGPDGVSEGRETGRVVVLAAHTIESARLLLNSPWEGTDYTIANTSDQVGRNLMDHLQGQAAAISPEPLFPFRGPPTTSGIDAFRDGPERAERAAFRMSIGNDGMGRVEPLDATLLDMVERGGLFGAELRARFSDRATRMFRISYSTEMLPDKSNRVTLSDSQTDGIGIPRAVITVGLDDYNTLAFESARRVMRAIFKRMGVTEQFFSDGPKANEYSGAGHIIGTCRMGADPAKSVVDADCRAHTHPNLFIVGASVFPTGGTANPTLTVAALALRAAERIADDLAAGLHQTQAER